MLTKKLLFGELLKSRPFYGTKQQWRDVANADLKSLNVLLKDWYELTMNRNGWYYMYTRGNLNIMDSQHPGVKCSTVDFSCA